MMYSCLRLKGFLCMRRILKRILKTDVFFCWVGTELGTELNWEGWNKRLFIHIILNWPKNDTILCETIKRIRPIYICSLKHRFPFNSYVICRLFKSFMPTSCKNQISFNWLNIQHSILYLNFVIRFHNVFLFSNHLICILKPHFVQILLIQPIFKSTNWHTIYEDRQNKYKHASV